MLKIAKYLSLMSLADADAPSHLIPAIKQLNVSIHNLGLAVDKANARIMLRDGGNDGLHTKPGTSQQLGQRIILKVECFKSIFGSDRRPPELRPRARPKSATPRE